MKKILLTGAKGQLGLELTNCFKADSSLELILTDVDILDITNIDSVWKIVNEQKPQIIINCAAHTAVDKCETDENNAYKINAIGARNLAIVSNDIGAEIVHISTDYVFDGDGIIGANGQKRAYTEFDKVNPQTVYGRTKVASEDFVRIANPKHYIIRTAWLYGEGNNFVRTMLKLAEKHDTLKVVNDQYGTPTSTQELTGLILHFLGTRNYGLFHGTCERECTWYDFTREIFKLMNISREVIPVTTDEFPRPAKRPKYSVLDNYMLKLTTSYKFNDWKDALKKYLKR